MKLNKKWDAVVVGSGPNGLAAAITLAQSGLSVCIFEKMDFPGGGLSSRSLTLPGFQHDVCSAVHPLAVSSPFFRSLPLEKYGLKWIYSPASLAHPLDDGTAILLHRSLEETAASLGRDNVNYQKFFNPFVLNFKELMEEILTPLIRTPKYFALMARFGLNALMSAEKFSRFHFYEDRAKSLFSGNAAHSLGSLKGAGSAAIGMVLQIAGHAVGWPIPQGGSQALSKALLDYFKSMGGEVLTGIDVQSIDQLPDSRFLFFDLTPQQILRIAGDRISRGIRQKLSKFRYGPGVFKMDWALSSPIPWRAKECLQAATVHLGGNYREIIQSEEAPFYGKVSETPFVLLSQPTLFDDSRAPSGSHIAWAYIHVPHGSHEDQTERIENQIERFAPGFRKTILKRSTMNTRDLESHNSNLIGGDISGGLVNLQQVLFRPILKWNPYLLDEGRIWICSASSPPGPGVHGMCGFNAAVSCLENWRSAV